MSQSVKMFFQVILPRTLQLGKLEIPQNFVRLYGEKFLFGNSIILTAPNGDMWPMSLEKTNDGSAATIGGDGWTEFAKHYSVGAMDFIMFQYKCHHKSIPVFNVLILNESTNMEIPHYPTKHRPTPRRAKSNGIAASFEKRQSIHKAGRCYLGIPIRFLRKTGLCNKAKVLLKGETGVEREVKLKHRTRVCRGGSVEHKRYHLGCGWKAFREDNDIANTDKLKFQHISGCLIAVTKVV